jgi:L-seryl-tRNA(Ser) seleniumtransferase
VPRCKLNVTDPSVLRNLPRVDDVLADPAFVVAAEGMPRGIARDAVRQAVAEVREAVRAGAPVPGLPAIVARAAALLREGLRPSLRRAVNATGVVLHTGLGRAPLSEAAQQALASVAGGYSNLQSDVGSGTRMHREVHVEALLQRLTGAEAAVVVNNNAAATVLVLNTLAAGREVIVSRGEMIEIGGAFRIPDIIALSGCRLVEIGCTNRTHLRDYQRALTENTALLLSVHQSNYRIQGFASQVPVAAVAALAHQHRLLCAHDLGSGAFLDLQQYGLPHEPSVPESIAAGADVAFFSGDKLIGGPQCGIVVGKADLVEAMHRNPYYRVFRVDKLTLAALEATLRLFLDPEHLPERHRVTAMLTAPLASLQARAEALAERLRATCRDWLAVEVRAGESEIGGGSLAGHTLPTAVVRCRARDLTAKDLADRLRLGDPPVFARVHDDAVVLDVRTLLPGEEETVAAAIAALGSGG